jgi:hypothetical protein
MTFLQLVRICDEAYSRDFPESALLEFVNRRTGQPRRRTPSPVGDTLALFVVRELAETFDAQAGDEAQIAEAARVMEMARANIENIISALGSWCPKREA